ncbi:DUF2723 domain-containing protein [Cytophagales bacterium LB-30]|uniref:DUF2723 domain-containing protein n=1 Tax=Shiella aurantiaca TaxID=3058365 RepID=A0ABT8F7E2_9BACT|nr:DUF2723 domain-containing protein [Shiella aurantiaca]MDN4166396.1 DUF2723 domain-containing protein [Shiella aurantiaca]
MHQFNKVNNITGWIVFAISAIVYTLTVEPTASFWDCGEFIAVSYKLEVPHPPGAPFFLLLGRMFSFLAMGDVSKVAYWINMLSVASSAFTILFLFWSITLLARKIVKPVIGQETIGQLITMMGAGAVGALAYTFSDSFWFSAVEAEVYAMSSFFTAFVVWAMLKWELIEDEGDANRWLIFIAYMMGLSIGVHLLNLVTIPALALIYYFKKYDFSVKGLIVALGISGFIVILINDIIIPGFPSITGSFEVFFVNNLGLPFGSGGVFFAAITLGSLIYGILYSIKNEKVLLNTGLMCLTVILIGYSSYTLVLIRSNYNPPIDENNPENLINFISYLKREQYGSRPLVFGQLFTAELVDQKRTSPVYVKGKDKYEVADYKLENIYDPKHTTLLPRMWSNQPSHVQRYQEIMGLRPGEKPSFFDNISYMLQYQIGHMYLRYFMWNFVGRSSDIDGASWETPFNAFEKVPEAISSNEGRNNFLMLPLILGLIGLIFQYTTDKRNFAFVGMLFFLTGAALVLYLNSPPIEPRERDYIYVGSYYAFAIWIGLGVVAIITFLQKKMKEGVLAPVATTLICFSVPGIMAAEGWDDHDRSNRYFSVDSAKNMLASCAPNAILFTGGDNDTFPLWYVQEVEGFRTDVRVVVLSYFNTDWYVDQMTRPAYESQPFPFSLKREQYKSGGLNDVIYYVENPNVKGAINLEQYMKLVKESSKAIQYNTPDANFNTIPSKDLFLNVDTAAVLAKGIIPDAHKSLLTSRMALKVKGRVLEKKDIMLLDMLVTNKWERPIYFNNTSLQSIGVDLRKYVVHEGTTYRLLPVENPDPRQELVNTEVMYDHMVNNFFWRELNNPEVYYNENYRNFVLNHRSSFNTLARGLYKEGKNEQAIAALKKSIEVMPHEVVAYDYATTESIGLLLALEQKEMALEMASKLWKTSSEQFEYYLETDRNIGMEKEKHFAIMNQTVQILRAGGASAEAAEYQETLMQYYEKLNM